MEILKFLESIRSPALTAFFRFWTLFGEETVCIVIICIFYWCINKKFGCKMIYTLLFSGLLVQTLKITFRVESPWVKDPDFQAVEAVLPKATGYSFPSGHTQTAAAVFMPLGNPPTAAAVPLPLKREVKKKNEKNRSSVPFPTSLFKGRGTARRRWGDSVRIISIFIILMVALSRLYLGVHTPLDVVVSIVLTVAISFVVDYIQKFGWIIVIIAFFISLFISEPDLVKMAALGVGAVTGLYIERKWIKFETKFNPFIIIIGLGILYLIKSFVHSENLLVISAQYLLIALWITALYPLIFNTLRRRYFSRKQCK